MRRLGFALILLGLVLGACTAATTQTTTSVLLPLPSPVATVATSQPATTATIAEIGIEGRVGLYPMNPLSLEPLGSLPITTGDWLRGSASPNAEWLALSVWIDTEPDTDLIRIVNVVDGKEVAEAKVLVPTNPIVSDRGIAYWTQGSSAPILRLYSLTPGDDSSELAFDDFPDRFETWMEPTILDSDRLGWLGRFALPTGESVPGLVVLDLASATTTSFLLSDVRLSGDEVVVDDTSLFEWYEPEVVWDSERNVAYVVHADQDVFTSVDLNTGETSTRTWAQESSWLGRLFAWLITPAQAKGLSLGTRRSVALSPDGSTLFVGTFASQMETAEDSNLSVLWQPEGVVALDTGTGAVTQSWSIPASDVYLAPSGDYLVAIGWTVRESLLSGSTTGEGAFIIHVRSGEVIRHLPETDDNGGVVQFSADGEIAYLTDYEGKVEIIDLATGDLITENFGPQELTVFGRAGLIATRR